MIVVRRSFQRLLSAMMQAVGGPGGEDRTFGTVSDQVLGTIPLQPGTDLQRTIMHALGLATQTVPALAANRAAVYYQAPSSGAVIVGWDFVAGTRMRVFNPGAAPALAAAGTTTATGVWKGVALRGTLLTGHSTDPALGVGLIANGSLGGPQIPRLPLEGGQTLAVSSAAVNDTCNGSLLILEYPDDERA